MPRPIDVRCPRCKAAPGLWCKRKYWTGRSELRVETRRELHEKRKKAARKAGGHPDRGSE